MSPRPDDDLVIDHRRLAPRSSATAGIPRLVYGILAAFVVVIPIAMGFVIRQNGSLLNGSSGLTLVRLWLVALILLLVWCLVYLAKEPLLARIACGFLALLLIYAAVRTNRFTVNAPAKTNVLVTPTPLQKPEPLASRPADLASRPTVSPAPSAATGNSNLASAIIGNWKHTGANGVIQFTKMGTSMEIDDDGHGGVMEYAVVDGNRLTFSFAGVQDQPEVYNNVEVTNNKLAFTDEEGTRVTYDRGSSDLDPDKVVGTWTTQTGDATATFASDGTFAFGDVVGRWAVLGKQVMARAGTPNGSELHLIAMGAGPDSLNGQRVDPATHKTAVVRLMRK